jgi:hypothetical protein
MAPHPVFQLVRPAATTKDRPFSGLMKCLGARRFTRAPPGPAPQMDADPYFLLLLADQELIDGREEQAQYLIESVYEIFDQKSKTSARALYQS